VQPPRIADYPPGARLPARVIGDYEFVWMLRGRARFVTEGAAEPLGPGQLLLVPPRLRHGFDWDPTRPSRHGYVHFGLDDAGCELPGEVRLVRMSSDDPLSGLCAYLLWLGADTGRGWREPARRTLRFMLALVHAGPLPECEPPLPHGLLGAVAYLRREWSGAPLRRMPVAELAGAARVTRGHLNRLFHNGFGQSTAAALERIRCARAEILLTRTDLPVEVIAGECGFADPSHFSHRFTAIHGIPPRAYRIAGGGPSVLDHPGVRRLSRLLWD
jgi:AraC family transcriptional regulator